MLNCHSVLILWNHLRFLDDFLGLDDFFDDIWYRLDVNSFSVHINWHSFFKSYRNRYLDRMDYNVIDVVYNDFFNWNTDYFINVHLYWYLLSLYHNSFLYDLLDLFVLHSLDISFHDGVLDVDRLIDCNVYYFFALDFDWFLDKKLCGDVVHFWRHLDWNLNNFLNYFLYNLWNLNNFLDDSWHCNNLLYNSLNLNHFGYLYYLFNDLLLDSRDLFDPLIVYFLRNYFLLPEWYRYFFSHNMWLVADNFNRSLLF